MGKNMKIWLKPFIAIILGAILVNSVFGAIDLGFFEKPKLIEYLPAYGVSPYYEFSTKDNPSIRAITRISLYELTGSGGNNVRVEKLSDSSLKLVSDGVNTDINVNDYLIGHLVNKINFNLVDSMLPRRIKLHLMLAITWQDNKGEDHPAIFHLVRGSAEELGAEKTELQTSESDADMVIPGLPPTVDLPIAKSVSTTAIQPINTQQTTRLLNNLEILGTTRYIDNALRLDADIAIQRGAVGNWFNRTLGTYMHLTLHQGTGVAHLMVNLNNFIPNDATLVARGVNWRNEYVYFWFNNGYMVVVTFPNTRLPNILENFQRVYTRTLNYNVGYIVYNRNRIGIDGQLAYMREVAISPDYQRALALTQDRSHLYSFSESSPTPTELQIPIDSKGSNLVKDILATKNGDLILMEDGKTIDAEGYNGGQENLLGLGNNVENQPNLAKVDLSQINFAPNEQFDHFANDANINNEDQVAVVSTLSRYLAWGLNVIGRLTGTLPRWVTDTGVTAYGTTLEDSFYKIYNIHTHKFDWKVCGVWGKFMGSTAMMGASNVSGTEDFVPCDPDHTDTLFSTSI
jgi:hypothetical protein